MEAAYYNLVIPDRSKWLERFEALAWTRSFHTLEHVKFNISESRFVIISKVTSDVPKLSPRATKLKISLWIFNFLRREYTASL